MELWSLRLLSRMLHAFDNLCIRKDGTVNRKWDKFLGTQVPANPQAKCGVSTVDVIVDFEKDVWVRLFIPKKKSRKLYSLYKKSKPQAQKLFPIIFFYHGGGFVFLSPDSVCYDTFCRRLARKCHALVISVHYRRAPEHKFPAAYDDCFAALEWLQSGQATQCLPRSIDPRCIDLSRVFLCGDSAGGNIAHHVAVRASETEISPLCIKGVMLLSPFFGGQERTPAEIRVRNVPMVSVKRLDWYWKSFLPHGANRDHPACNIFGRNSPDLSDVSLPSVLIIIGGLDILQDWETRYADCLNRAGKDVKVFFYKNGIHSFGLFDQTHITKQMFFNIMGFIDNH
ncbi:probable carboxylesterase 18 isoform X2 [Physcomitrium patens]|uniref:Alpha/beta hydrolase fold-3 domain-containing protein n=1 Tax=Physcomitrium patens TaxID=3218 RepID=A0A2K1JQ79_PHYPA|nr:hypothetical protein PHYPA_016071 [Physcomitrium patens]